MLAENSSLIIEGGGMRGIIAAGVLDSLLKNDIEFAHCIGVSAGACHSCSFVSKQFGRAIAVNTDFINMKGYGDFGTLIKTGDFFSPELLYDRIPNELSPYDYEAVKKGSTVLQTVVTNCITGEAEYPTLRPVPEDIIYVRASSSLPLLSNFVMIDGKPYLDGGIADSIPVEHSFSLGYDKNIVILTQPEGYVKHKNEALPLIRAKYRKYPKLVEAMENRHIVYNNELKKVSEYEAQGKLFVIRPRVDIKLGRLEKNKDKLFAAYNHGFDLTNELMPQIKEFLNL